jgi:NhaP-type Na+/H+ or K+/H+ antiporter
VGAVFGADSGFHFAETYPTGLLFLGLAVFAAIGALSHQRERAFSASLIYLGLGVAGAIAVGVLDLDWLQPVADAQAVERAAELAVVIALFSAGLKLDRPLNWRSWSSVARLLAIAMPLTIAAIALFGTAVLGLSLGAAIVLGAALAPTDPVLAGDIGVGPPGDEDEREPNFALTSEAGLNDGLAFPFVLLGLSVAEGGEWGLEWLTADVLYAIAAGVALGAGLGLALAWSIKRLRDLDLLIPALDSWVAVAATLAIYGLAEVAGGYGFLAVFAGGLAFRRYEHDHEINARVHTGAEMVEKFGELALILLLGSMLSLEGLGLPGIGGWLLAVVAIVAIRPLSVFAALAGSQLERKGERAFVAWFGVRGIGTLYYIAAATVTGTLAADERETVVWTGIICVVVSIVVHGISASPLGRRLAPESAA